MLITIHLSPRGDQTEFLIKTIIPIHRTNIAGVCQPPMVVISSKYNAAKFNSIIRSDRGYVRGLFVFDIYFGFMEFDIADTSVKPC